MNTDTAKSPRGFYSLPSHLEGDNRRLNQQHEVFRLILSSSLLHTPVSSCFQGFVLDVGTGTGIWATEFAAEHPNAQVTGIDLFDPLKSAKGVPPNCAFGVANAEGSDEEWDSVVPPGSFDLIHTRMFLMILRDARTVVERIFRALRPGGRVEFQEKQDPYRSDDPSPEAQDTPLLRHARLRVEAAARCGLDRAVARLIPMWMAEIGFEEIEAVEYKIPIGPWMEGEAMKIAGTKYLECLEWGTLGFSKTIFIKGLGWTEEQVLGNVRGAVNDLGNGKVYSPIMFITGRKPARSM
ncbi:S-adenosyl-L-methionine-dependent methyltransferase [Echria macrotheca]|uniref:S-adenosyl-L-methionine-dependent methyltransferase n=1 Tax=Echria macrotheca TaxID=438768 RepID=A0AAJ0F1Y5_9PEZI|nr:S-adenosyl-L-methionine-dependent methyltransferase [Echria macrotheca]